MNSLFEAWKTKVPNFDAKFKDTLFASLTKTGGGSEKTKIDFGKHFSNNYELYMYAFFLGLYKNEATDLKVGEKENFRHAIENWGSTSNRLDRDDFTKLQQYIFMAVVAKTEIDFIALEKGDIQESEAVKALINTMEAITNGGLILIKEKLDDNPNHFLQSTAFLDFIDLVKE